MEEGASQSGTIAMRRRSRLTGKVLRPPFIRHEKKDHLVCYLWGGTIDHALGRIVSSLGAWRNDRDSVFCERILQETHFGVHCPTPYESSFEWSEKEGRNVPWQMTKRFYKIAKDNGYKWIHLVGYSGGGAVASSVLAHHSDKKDANMVKSLIVINGQIAEREGDYSCLPYTDGAYYAEGVKARTLLIYGDADPCRKDADEWKKRNKAEVPPFYHGGHDFGETPETFNSVTKTVIDFLKNSPDQGLRLLKLRRLRRKRHTRRRAKTGSRSKVKTSG